MDPFLTVCIVVAATLSFAFANGWSDAANAVATVVSTRVLSPTVALLWSAALNFAGALVGTEVAYAVGTELVALPAAPEAVLVVLAAALAATLWIVWCTRRGLPISASHSLVGGLAGAAVALYGAGSLQWDGLFPVLIAIVASPCLGAAVAFALLVAVHAAAGAFRFGSVRAMTATVVVCVALLGLAVLYASHAAGTIDWIAAASWLRRTGRSAIAWLVIPVIAIAFGALYFLKGMSPAQARRWFGPLQVCSSSLVAFEHGKNDAQKSMGAILLALIAAGYLDRQRGAAAIGQSVLEIPAWVMLSCGLAVALGTAAGGWNVIRTLGSRLAPITAPDGFVAETTAGLLLETSAELGIPVSTTHTITGAIVGVGTAKRRGAVKWRIGARILAAWLVTLPLTFAGGAALALLGREVGPVAVVALAGGAGGAIVAWDGWRARGREAGAPKRPEPTAPLGTAAR